MEIFFKFDTGSTDPLELDPSFFREQLRVAMVISSSTAALLLSISLSAGVVGAMDLADQCTAAQLKVRDRFETYTTACAKALWVADNAGASVPRDILCGDACHLLFKSAVDGHYPNCKTYIEVGKPWDQITDFYFNWQNFGGKSATYAKDYDTYRDVWYNTPKDACKDYTPIPIAPNCSADDIDKIRQLKPAIEKCSKEFMPSASGNVSESSCGPGKINELCNDACSEIVEASLNGTYPYCDTSKLFDEFQYTMEFVWGSEYVPCSATYKRVKEGNDELLNLQVVVREAKESACRAPEQKEANDSKTPEKKDNAGIPLTPGAYTTIGTMLFAVFIIMVTGQ